MRRLEESVHTANTSVTRQADRLKSSLPLRSSSTHFGPQPARVPSHPGVSGNMRGNVCVASPGFSPPCETALTVSISRQTNAKLRGFHDHAKSAVIACRLVISGRKLPCAFAEVGHLTPLSAIAVLIKRRGPKDLERFLSSHSLTFGSIHDFLAAKKVLLTYCINIMSIQSYPHRER